MFHVDPVFKSEIPHILTRHRLGWKNCQPLYLLSLYIVQDKTENVLILNLLFFFAADRGIMELHFNFHA